MNDQKQHWDTKHLRGDLDHYSDKASSFASQILQIIEPSSKILELGCGVGNDAFAFANAGNIVLATDFSKVAIDKCRKRFQDIPNLTFEAVDMNDPFPFDKNEFDIVYAMLSLHYFTDKTTKMIFGQIHKVLKEGGFLFFVCKSIKDPKYGQGTQIEKDMFERTGQIRHFFSSEYVKECLKDKFEILKIGEGEENFYSSKSAFVEIMARAI